MSCINQWRESEESKENQNIALQVSVEVREEGTRWWFKRTLPSKPLSRGLIARYAPPAPSIAPVLVPVHVSTPPTTPTPNKTHSLISNSSRWKRFSSEINLTAAKRQVLERRSRR